MNKNNQNIKKSKISKPNSWRFLIGEEKDYFMENLSMLLSSGMNILSAIESVKIEIKSKTFRQIITDMASDIADGLPLWQALDKEKLFPSQIISLVKIGEESGKLADNLKVIIDQQAKERVFKSRIKSAMLYPVLVMSLTVIIGAGVAWFILPKLASVFASLRIELPVITQYLIAIGVFLGKYGAIIVPAFLVFSFLVILLLFVIKQTKFMCESINYTIPGVKELIQQTELSRFGYILGSLLDAGLPIVSALDSLAEATTTRAYRDIYFCLKENVDEGNSFQKSFLKRPKIKKYIPSPIQQMIIAGEQSGNLPDTLKKIGVMFEDKTESSTKDLAIILEPILLVIVWLGVMAVALSVILPVYSLIGGLQDQTDNQINSNSNSAVQQTITNPAPAAPTAVMPSTSVSTPTSTSNPTTESPATPATPMPTVSPNNP